MSNIKENENALYAHKLEVRKLVLDKLLIGALIVIVGFAANFSIERYRVQTTKERFLLEKKLAAIQEITKAYMAMHNKIDSQTLKMQLQAPQRLVLKSSVDDFIDIWTHQSVILSEEFTLQMDFVTWIYIGMAHLDLNTLKSYREFMFDIYYKFYAITREELGISEESTVVKFDFVDWSVKKANEMGADIYLKENFKKWQSYN